MFEASAVGIALIDENQRFVAANEAFQKMLGYSSEELCSLGPAEITHEDDRRATQDMLDEMLANHRFGYDVEKRYRRKDGTIVWARVRTCSTGGPQKQIARNPHHHTGYHRAQAGRGCHA